jgi:hypothetical protein
MGAAEAMAEPDHPLYLAARIRRLEEQVDSTWLPISFRPLQYQLRMHISLVRERIERTSRA